MAFTDTGPSPQLFVRDRVAGTTTLASSNAAGAAANGAVETEDVGNVLFAISGSGRYVVFTSTATNLSPQDTDANLDVFRKDLVTGAVDLISVNSAGQKANAGGLRRPGRLVRRQPGLVRVGYRDQPLRRRRERESPDIVVRDVAAGTTVLAAQNNAGVQANGTTERSAISADGRAVAFEAPAGTTNLAPDDTGRRERRLSCATWRRAPPTPASDPSR